jgi:type 1 glutamine amidotransferase
MRQLKRIVLVATVKDHGPGEHDYPAWQKAWLKLIGQAEGCSVTNAWKWPTTEQFETADLLVFYFWNHNWTPETYQQLDAFLARGGGIVLLHSSCIADQDPESLAERMGLASHPKRSKYRHGELDLRFITPANHPLTAALPKTVHFLDETYWPLFGDTNKAQVIATAEEEGKDWPMVWTFSKGKGRVFGTVLGHYYTTFDDPFFRILVLRGMAWAAHEPISRFEKLATVDVRFKDE